MHLRIDTDRMLVSLRQLAKFGAQGTGVNRPVLSDADVASRYWLAEQMRTAGLTAVIDAVGNVVGRCNAPRALLIGSHTDSVPTGGWLDGALGVMYGIELARALNEQYPNAHVGIDVASFADEEGRFLSCLGSKHFCGELTKKELENLSYEGISYVQAARSASLTSQIATLDVQRHVAYLEAHIEQGPRLDDACLDIGVVTGIAGMHRYSVTFNGQADHAGTTPMSMRKDAATAAFEFALDLRAGFQRLKAPDAVWNFGQLHLQPGVANVVPRQANLMVEIRELNARTLKHMQSVLETLVQKRQGLHGVGIVCEQTRRLPPVSMDTEMTEHVARAATLHTTKTLRMHSGAIHDAMVLAQHIPAAMLFVPSIGGRSHTPREDTSLEHLRLGAQVLASAAQSIITHKVALAHYLS